MGIVPEFNNNMRTKNFLRATLLAATLVVAGYGGMKAYNYAYAKRVNSGDNMLMQNIEALTQVGEGSGIPYGTCYTRGLTGSSSYAIACNDSTTSDMMYPCANEMTLFIKGPAGVCYKK